MRISLGLSSPTHKPFGVFFQDAAVLNHKQPGSTGTRGGFFMDDPFLHPHRFGSLAHGGLDTSSTNSDRRKITTISKASGTSSRVRVSLFSENGLLIGIHGKMRYPFAFMYAVTP